MSRELVWTGFVSADGIADSPGGESEGHRNGGWVFKTPFVAEAYSLKGEELADTTALMFGRRSYEAFSAIWPSSEDHASYRDLPKYVVSTTLGADDLVSGWGETTILRSLDEVAALKNSGEGGIFIHGSPQLARSLAEARLIDRYNLLIFPVLLGAGKSPWSMADRAADRLSLRESEAYSNGVIKAIYDVVP